jgi:hypothetical protein
MDWPIGITGSVAIPSVQLELDIKLKNSMNQKIWCSWRILVTLISLFPV